MMHHMISVGCYVIPQPSLESLDVMCHGSLGLTGKRQRVESMLQEKVEMEGMRCSVIPGNEKIHWRGSIQNEVLWTKHNNSACLLPTNTLTSIFTSWISGHLRQEHCRICSGERVNRIFYQQNDDLTVDSVAVGRRCGRILRHQFLKTFSLALE